MSETNWETVVPHTSKSTADNPPTRRMSVPGGWLYQVAEMKSASHGAWVAGWMIPVFVAEKRKRRR